MTQSTQQLREFSAITESFDREHGTMRVVGSYSVKSTTTEVGTCEVVVLDQSRPREPILPNHVSIEDIEAQLKKIPGMAEELSSARRWVGQVLYEGKKDLRSLRLARGLTQTMLAAKIGTSQPHLARMERGVADVMRETMRRLCVALEVDMNTLDAALQASSTAVQEAN